LFCLGQQPAGRSSPGGTDYYHNTSGITSLYVKNAGDPSVFLV
jgi:hypothetical protein